FRCAEYRGFLARQTKVTRMAVRGDSLGRFLGFNRITRSYYDHMWQHAHEGDVFEHLMRRAVRSDTDAGVAADYLYRHFIQAYGRADLFPVSSRTESRVAASERDLSGSC